MLRILLTLVLKTLLAITMRAQCSIALRGEVQDAQSKLPVSYVLIDWDGAPTAVPADTLGRFALTNICPGTHVIELHRIGFSKARFEITINSDTTLVFPIRFDPKMFEVVNISARRNTLQSTDIGQTIDSEQLDKLRGSSLAEVTSTIPGVSMLSTGGTIEKPVIHGLHSNRIILINHGVRQEGQQWGSEHAPELDVFATNQITVIKGPGALRYGHDGIGGAIITESNPISAHPLNVQAFSAIQTNGRSDQSSLQLEGIPAKLNWFSWRVQGTASRSGTIQTPQRFLDNTGSSSLHGSAQLNITLRKWSAELYYNQFNTKLGIYSGSHIGNLTDLYSIINGATPLDITTFNYAIGRPMQHATHELVKANINYLIGDHVHWKTQYARQYNLREEYDKHRPRNDSIAALNLPEMNLEITTHQVQSWFDVHSEHASSLSVGAQWTNQGNTYAGRFFIPNYIHQSMGGFITSKKSWRKHIFEAAARYDSHDYAIYTAEAFGVKQTNHHYQSPSASLGYRFSSNKHLRITFNSSIAWRAPGVKNYTAMVFTMALRVLKRATQHWYLNTLGVIKVQSNFNIKNGDYRLSPITTAFKTSFTSLPPCLRHLTFEEHSQHSITDKLMLNSMDAMQRQHLNCRRNSN
jgi:iron complex outermembrane receptor protein